MKKIILFMILFLFLVGIEVCGEPELEIYLFCRGITITDPYDFTQPIFCDEETSKFYTTDTEAYIMLKLSSLTEGDEIVYEISDSSGTLITDESKIVPEALSRWYDYREIEIEEKSMQPGDYFVKMHINGVELISDTFTIEEDLSDACEGSGFYCCPSSNICLSPRYEICNEGFVCCESENACTTHSQTPLSRTLVTNCEGEELEDCGRVVKLYDYSISAEIEPAQTIVIDFRGVDIDCMDKTDVVIAYYDYETDTWVERSTVVEETATDSYKVTALLNYLGYVALIRSEECVPTLCTYGGSRTKPISGYVNFGEDITFELCGIVRDCEAIEGEGCSRPCVSGVDPDCGDCTSSANDCCLISYDGICDTDCAPGVDPDCCDKDKELCCPGDSQTSGSEGCDKNCGTSDSSCSDCTSEGENCCKATSDGTCDPDCPKLSNGVGYLDIDCCRQNSIPITSAEGDCCNAVCDCVCDPDCIAGLDPDCYYGYCANPCGDGLCCHEDCGSCPSDCGCSQGYTCSWGVCVEEEEEVIFEGYGRAD